MSRVAFLIIIAAMIAGAIGFGIAVYAVPLEEIVQFRALINAGPARSPRPIIRTTATPGLNIQKHGVRTRRENSTHQPKPAATPLQHAISAARNAWAGLPQWLPVQRTFLTATSAHLGVVVAAGYKRPRRENGPAASVPSSAPSAGSSDKAPAAPGSRLKPPAKKAKPKSAPPSNPEK